MYPLNNGIAASSFRLPPPEPQPIFTNLQGWFKSNAGITLSGANVTQWASQYGVSGLLANTGTLSPTLTGALNGYTAVTMAAGSTPMLFNNAVSVSSAYTFFGVIKQTGNYAEYILTRSGGGLAGAALTPGFGGPGIFLFDGGNLPIGGQNLTTPQYATWQSSSAGTNLRQNGTAVVTGGARVTANPTGLFSNNSSGTISIWEVLIYATALNSTDIATVESYLKTKYAL